MDVIRIYDPSSEEYARLSLAATAITMNTPIACKVADCYFDIGANMRWTTILGYYPRSFFKEIQILSPAQQEKLISPDANVRFEAITEISALLNSKYAESCAEDPTT